MDEKQKYEQVWDHIKYRESSPAERRVDQMLRDMGNSPLACVRTILDAGCGTGRAAMKLAGRGFDVRLIDIADNCLDKKPFNNFVNDGRFTSGTVTELPWPDKHFDLYFSCDVLEHLPPDEIEAALSEAARVARKAYLEVCTVADQHHKMLGTEPLHLTIRDTGWWIEQARSRWKFVSGRFTGTHVMMECVGGPR